MLWKELSCGLFQYMSKFNPQNIYDNPDFFQGYSALRKNEQGFNALIEQPAIRSLLPDLAGKKVIDLGCGFGDLCRYIIEQGAESVLGVDISEKMLAIAKTKNNVTGIQYQRSAIETFTVKEQSVDLIVSSAAFHYIADYLPLVKKIHAGLKSNGYLIFSIEHPMCTSNSKVIRCETLPEHWPIFNYRDEGQFQQIWFVDNVIKYHRTLQTYVNGLIETDFTVKKILEPMPDDNLIANRPDFAIHKIRPPLLVISAQKLLLSHTDVA